MTRVNTLTEIWKTYSDTVVNENVPGLSTAKQGSKPGKKPIPAAEIKKGFRDEKSTGPENAEGFKTTIDPKQSKVKDELYDSENYSSEKYNKKLKKKMKESINNYMKSTFDKLFENVMSDEEQKELEALGVDVDDDGDIDVEATDEVTVTLGAEHVKALKEILAQIEPEETEAEDMEHEDMEHEDMEHEDYEEMEEHEDGEEEDEEVAHEAVDTEDAGHSLVNQKEGNPTPVTSGSNVVKSTVSSKAKKGKGGKNSKPSITSASTSDEGHALVNQRKGNPDKISAGSNKVGSLTVGADLFGDN